MDRIDRGAINERIHFRVKPFNPKNRFEVLQRGKQDVSIVLHLANGETITFPDFPVTIDGGTTGLEDAEFTPRQVFLSPDSKHILVEKHIDSTTNIGQAFVRVGDKARQENPGGLRFDEACVRYFCKTHGIPLARVTGGGRDFFPLAWHDAAVGVFDIASSNSGYDRKDKKSSIFFRVEYDFNKKQFLSARAVPWFR